MFDSESADYIDVYSKNIKISPCVTWNQQIILMFIAKTSNVLRVRGANINFSPHFHNFLASCENI
jgi:hypothetical protein